MTQSKERVMGEEGLYRSSFEHDNCGIGAVVNIKGEKSHATVENALKIVENLEHRAGKDAEGKTGDGVGILLQISHKFFSKACSYQRNRLLSQPKSPPPELLEEMLAPG